uniref:CCHC-type domain-containing protein n=3 Tax=Gasterosteus aculeatus aculeatus TaxID=481459 RepID=A0AAQ4QJP3_GASAC
MNPADLDSVSHAVSLQGNLLGQHSTALQEIMSSVQALSASLSAIQAQLNAPAASPPTASPPALVEAGEVSPSVREPKVPTPERYEGDLGGCRSFLLQCGLVFDLQPQTYHSDKAKIAFVIGLLRGKALEWASAIWEQRDPCTTAYQEFTAELRRLFDHPTRGKDAAKRLFAVRQGNRSVAEYVIEFRTLAVESGWNNESLQAVFYQGLTEPLKDELISYPEPQNLEDLVALSIRVDNRCRERRRERRLGLPNHPRSPNFFQGTGHPNRPTLSETREVRLPDPEPMQVGRQGLSTEERQRRRDTRSCLYCGRAGHYISSCPQRQGNSRAR